MSENQNNDEAKDVMQLRQALSASPDNNMLRLLLVSALLDHKDYAGVEAACLPGLKQEPSHEGFQLALCEAYQHQGKPALSLVILEEILKKDKPPAKAWYLNACYCLAEGDVAQALVHYRKAVKQDEDLVDMAMAERLGMAADEEGHVLGGSEGRLRSASISADGDLDMEAEAEMEKPTVAFKHVGGMESVKEEIRLKIIHPLNNKSIYEAYGKKIGGGVLMFGPPGCGKTHLARATAGEISGNFLSVGLHDILDMWIGQSEKHLHQVFETARNNTPTVLFFDEVDALAANRSDLKQSNSKQMINQFLSELDGVDDDNDGVLILAATNAPWHLDPAFRRPGRFDRIIFVPPPDAQARESILVILLADKPTKDVDCVKLAKKTNHYSGADLKNLIDMAVEEKIQTALKTGIPEPLTTKDLLAATKRMRPSTEEWFATAKNYALYANQGGIYDDILSYLKS